MIAYQYDSAGLYQGEFLADESPLEPGVFLLPARCTTAPPPQDLPATHCPRWNGTTWDIVNRPQLPAGTDPVAKLAEFLAQNPDVAALIAGAAP